VKKKEKIGRLGRMDEVEERRCCGVSFLGGLRAVFLQEASMLGPKIYSSSTNVSIKIHDREICTMLWNIVT
jgi:hypothetical protein